MKHHRKFGVSYKQPEPYLPLNVCPESGRVNNTTYLLRIITLFQDNLWYIPMLKQKTIPMTPHNLYDPLIIIWTPLNCLVSLTDLDIYRGFDSCAVGHSIFTSRPFINDLSSGKRKTEKKINWPDLFRKAQCPGAWRRGERWKSLCFRPCPRHGSLRWGDWQVRTVMPFHMLAFDFYSPLNLWIRTF